MFTGDDGVSAKIDAAVKRITGTDGTIPNRTEGLAKTIKTLEAQHARTSLSIDTMMEGIRAQFVALDALVARMQGTSDYLTQQFNALNNSRNHRPGNRGDVRIARKVDQPAV
ncbi:hypothetical protein PSTG_19608 [Puccinia striiformis f. sp. tritici PST-78]|uniref:Flagellar hook-associated protein 2 C-terminal domain-containing protein n=1 Tax=Puccinia striiformis f. sp. tritici PST-78 TaxID=1165861 RepID=A0A0L0UK07_9BASI|nr:hypothetical protein PSTG_19608 [Puccinia striiformis f. sp. tritici PST-78]